MHGVLQRGLLLGGGVPARLRLAGRAAGARLFPATAAVNVNINVNINVVVIVVVIVVVMIALPVAVPGGRLAPGPVPATRGNGQPQAGGDRHSGQNSSYTKAR
ncbi:hypothetical protein [Streptomyces marincola]|uniref:hypothetical protein n=1 Tax=Streptomyces marincola TaxID=2878388 RepID=UPI001CF4CCB9|nr:hypothetical protein [Streptomyces marincola]UCM90232.1 hypothetical protein LC193_21095 [Streptomyces marincola]